MDHALIQRFHERAEHAERDGRTQLADDFRQAARIAKEWTELQARLQTLLESTPATAG
jgi:hypothetical protein